MRGGRNSRRRFRKALQWGKSMAVLEQLLDPHPPLNPRGAVPRRFSVEQYHAMIDAGFFEAGPQVELLNGFVVQKMSKNPPHRRFLGRFVDAFFRLLPLGWSVQVQESITLDDSEPEPDIAVIRGTHDDYVDCHPGPKDVALAIEVAESSLHQDLNIKAPLYARAGIAQYWIVDTAAKTLIVCSEPAGDGYQLRSMLSARDRVRFRIGEHSFELSLETLLG